MPHREADTESLEALLELHEEPVVLINDQYTIVAANQAYVASYAEPGADLTGKKCHRVSHHSDVPCHQRGEDCPVKRVMQTGKPVDTLHIHFNGSAEPERVRVRGFPIQHHGERLLAEKIQRISPADSVGLNAPAARRMVGNSSAFLSLLHRLVQVSAMPGTVLLVGESGVGKELAAQFVHEHSGSQSGPFVVVDCASIPDTLFEAELFGHEKGAYTGSGPARAGLFESADGGTLFLDEIGELPLPLQAKLLRAIDTGEIRRLGTQAGKTVQVRIVAATNRNVQEMVDQGKFRLDLYYRLATHEVRIPPLRERRDDIQLLAKSLLMRFDHVPNPTIQNKAIEVIAQLDLPGNVRELRNLLERSLVYGTDIGPASVRAAINSVRRQAVGHDPAYSLRREGFSPVGESGSTDEAPTDVRANRAYLLAKSLHRHNGNRARAAAELGVSERTVYRWMKHFCNDPNCNW
ncbi:MAG: sigma 54-interacting transcriptional regulator [Burkholderiaceae bacterium]